MFINPLAEKYYDEARLVGMCDRNPARMDFYNERIVKEYGREAVPTYAAEDFDKMIRETRPDTVLVCTIDGYHHEYIIRALDLGCDVITEKPLTVDAEKCRAIYDAVERTGKRVQITFNVRWQPGSMLIKKLLAEGTIGEIIHVDMEYRLNTSHGADYFRRWHATKALSGGLMVHKSTHHFDVVNWWIDAVPEVVFGFGSLAFYGKKNAEKRGIKVTGDRYLNQGDKNDPFYIDLSENETSRKLYLEAEKYDGYIRDGNVFRDNIDIEDTMSVLVKYRTGVTLNYSLNAYLPREGYHVAFNGTKGRLEYNVEAATHIVGENGEKELMHHNPYFESQIIVHPMFGKAYTVPIPSAEGSHGGADPLLQDQLFASNPPKDVWGATAEHGQGAASALIGIAANIAFATGQPQRITDLCPQIGDAVYLHDLP